MTEHRSHRANGVVAADGSLRIVAYGMMHKLTGEGEPIWLQTLVPHMISELDDSDEGRPNVDVFRFSKERLEHINLSHSPPLMLDGDVTLVVLPHRTVTMDAEGRLIGIYRKSVIGTGSYSPNLTHDQRPIFADAGGVSVWEADGEHYIRTYGYDIDSPAVYDDGTLAIAAYYGLGFCRMRRDGSEVWKTDFHEADLVPTLNDAEYAAVGSLNDHCSIIFTPDGKSIARYGAAARFARHRDDGWIACTETRLARLAPDGRLVWEQTYPAEEAWTFNHPIVDNDGQIYLLSKENLHMLDEKGRTRFLLKFDEPPTSMFPIRAGVMGVIAGYHLHLID